MKRNRKAIISLALILAISIVSVLGTISKVSALSSGMGRVATNAIMQNADGTYTIDKTYTLEVAI